MLTRFPKISIILPTYNRANYIDETIESVRNQTYNNWELIIVDDGSEDNTGEIISRINDERIRFYKAGRIAINGKIKNIGIEKANGELIAFIDSDDLWAETKLEKQIAALLEYPEAAFSLTGGFNFRDVNEPIDFFYRQKEGLRYGDIFTAIFKSEISTTAQSLVFRRECLVAGGFDETKPFSDIDFITKLASRFRAVVLYEPLLYRRLHNTNDSSTNWIKGYEQGVSLIQLYKKKLPASVVREALFKLYINFGEDCLLHKERKNAIRYFFYAWKNRPFNLIPFKKTAKGVFQAVINYGGNDPANISAKPWTKNTHPKRILAIRLQAMGDVTITLPYLQHLRSSLPASTKIDFLTRKECDNIPKNILLFNKVITIGGGRSFKRQLLYTFFLSLRFLFRRYDVVIDLQNNEISEIVRRFIRPMAWSVFDRFSPRAAGERTRLTIEAVGLGKNDIKSDFKFKGHTDSIGILKKNGWTGTKELVVLNPASAFITRNWPLENYVAFAGLWLKRFPNAQFLVIGTSFISPNADYLKTKMGDNVVSIVNQTTPSQAFAVLQHARFVLSEDSGLMHMAWVSGIPTLALFGSTRSDWTQPLGKSSFFLGSSDLPCGNCMQEVCKYGDVHCLTRYTPEFVFEKASQLVRDKGI
jgi:ADP-heptose:LPS heptosyltransferase/glycosyltransferase involved in cell wall biosynthesis